MSNIPAKTSSMGNVPSRSDSDIRQLCMDDYLQLNISQRAKRKCVSGGANDDAKGNELETSKSEIIEVMKEMMCAQNERLDKLEKHLMEIKKHNTEIKNINGELEKSLTFVSDQISSLGAKITGLEKERNTMVIKLSTLEEKVELLERNLIKTSVEIRNVPKMPNENKTVLYDMIQHLSNQLQIQTEPNSIRDVIRQPSKKENTKSNLTVEFSNSLTSSKFLTAVKEYNKRNPNHKLCSTHLGLKVTPGTPVYITEQLTPHAKRLFYLTRNFAKSNNYSFCWTSNGRVMLKKNPDSQVIPIKTEGQLQLLFNNITTVNDAANA
ncbi:hypothetical protein PYW08_009079 [Mythimna loreyi]|uniref:Uncharacterized protein n=1 Tax=Mythimna loreyi TaxID=667449 RepID=A0ACC2Q827_9NEOP|nr:hypothetical protein PYW08_009079 [Mythimna loreyi]